MKLLSLAVILFISLILHNQCRIAVDSEEANGFLKDFARNKPIGYSAKAFTEKLLEEVMKLALRDTLLKSGDINAIPTLKMVTLLDFQSLSNFFLKMNLTNNLTRDDFDKMIQGSFGPRSKETALDNEQTLDLFLSNLLKYISKSSENINRDVSKKKMYFYVYLVTKLKNTYLNQTSNNVSIANLLSEDKDINLAEFIDYTLKFNSSDLPFSEYFDEENLKKPEYQNKTLKEFSKMLHSYLKNGGKQTAMLLESKSEGTDIWMIILMGSIAIFVFIIGAFFTKKYLKNRYASLHNEATGTERFENNNVLSSAKV